ncbi:antiterminator LoaP [Ruminococcus sp. CLA-AA-H200]|uniref:Antiterminator LoaP n=1 Tax=Ruminococcus turbiniformis TaxID=2881258 RepID=A0ABS8G1B6_9FIRM|nr:antiterminator LoaP [Ruminococcus turbiniformis]MCC2256046.1 antiterminator LoaP [Ruminococcus turbiniformis]
MWCVLKCHSGKAEEIIASCSRNISDDILHDIFVFTYDRMKRYQGSWHVEKQQMFPDYVFMETEDAAALAESLEPYRRFVHILEGADMLQRIEPEEELFLRRLCGHDHHLKMSEGYIRNGITHVIRGPLVGMERRIRKIDRHKRIASIAIPAKGAERAMPAGLEITAKS